MELLELVELSLTVLRAVDEAGCRTELSDFGLIGKRPRGSVKVVARKRTLLCRACSDKTVEDDGGEEGWKRLWPTLILDKE